ncbi:hypothetical protein BCR44DRAFT_33929 [Catenaria anguillulae PL171]|uniref:Phosphatidate phosphatase APP1 catalytic domain-containing protein n=1 Tax=Catenaria anguillulae PL171 TaxID=765915 RepID=A0A1Y2HSH0_9FUNG|nr:hypothetical protein BCR44DRAFT_33929 [Catenaria anguillulae PL171]
MRSVTATLVLAALLASLANAGPVPVPTELDKRAWFSNPIEDVTLHNAVGRAIPQGTSGLCTVDGNVVARISHYDAITAGAFRLLAAGISLAIKTQEQRNHFNYVSPFFYADGNENAVVNFQVSGNGVSTQRIAGVKAANHGITTSPFRLTNVPCNAGSLPLSVSPGNSKTFEGASVQVVGERGFSVISDVDDTIRITEVLNKGKAVENTLINPFRPTLNFVEFYQRLSRSLTTQNGGAPVFHYVSGSPHMLHRPLQEFIKRVGYPTGQFFLNVFGIVDFDFWKGTQAHKLRVIPDLVKRFNKRSWVLIGDSGEQDPETYGIAAREALANGVDIKCIYIRMVSGTDAAKEAEQNKPERFAKAFEGIPKEKWVVFYDPKDVFNADIPNGKCQ